MAQSLYIHATHPSYGELWSPHRSMRMAQGELASLRAQGYSTSLLAGTPEVKKRARAWGREIEARYSS